MTAPAHTDAVVAPAHTPVKARLEWIDAAKGIAITLVVLGHVVWVLSLMDLPTSDFWRRILQATGPMRMPGFFLMSGLFAHRFAAGSFEKFARRRVIGFAYLFVVWIALTAAIEVGLKLWLGGTANAVSRTKFFDHVLWLETPMWYLVALPAFHLLWWSTRNLASWVPLAVTGIGYVIVDTGSVALPGMLASTGYRGMIQYSFFFMVGARLSHPLRHVVGRLTPWLSASILALWLSVELLVPTMPLKSLIAVPALFAISQLVVRTPLRSLAQRAGRRTLPLYLMNWLAVAIVGGVLLQVGVPSTRLTQFLVPGITLPVVIALIAGVWHLTKNIGFLWGPSATLENRIIKALRTLNDLEPTEPSVHVDTCPPTRADQLGARVNSIPMIHTHGSPTQVMR